MVMKNNELKKKERKRIFKKLSFTLNDFCEDEDSDSPEMVTCAHPHGSHDYGLATLVDAYRFVH